MNNKIILASIVIVCIVNLVIGIIAVNKTVETFGGYTSGHWDSADGYKVDGTTVIDGDGNYDGAVTGTTGTFSSTLTVSGVLTASADTVTADLIEGGGIYTTTSDTAGILTAANVCDNNVWSITPNTEAVTLTLPTVTALNADCLTSNGLSKELLIYNASTSDDTTTLITEITFAVTAGSDGIEFQSSTSSNAVIGAYEIGVLKFWRVSAATTVAALMIQNPAD